MVSLSPAYSLKVNSNLTELRLEKCGLNANDTAQLADILKDIPSLCVLDLSFNHVGTEAAKHLGNAELAILGVTNQIPSGIQFHFQADIG